MARCSIRAAQRQRLHTLRQRALQLKEGHILAIRRPPGLGQKPGRRPLSIGPEGDLHPLRLAVAPHLQLLCLDYMGAGDYDALLGEDKAGPGSGGAIRRQNSDYPSLQVQRHLSIILYC